MKILNENNNIQKNEILEKVAICSVCSLSHIPQTLTMIWSLRRFSEKYLYHIFITDLTSQEGSYIKSSFEYIEFHFIDEFSDETIFHNKLLLSNLEFICSLKGYAMKLVANSNPGITVYCDSDLYFLKDISDTVDTLRYSAVLLTPHQSMPSADNSEFLMARCGVFNAGFIGVNNFKGSEFLNWWGGKLANYCFLEPEEGLFVDQKWLDIAPSIFDNVNINRNAGLNIGYWNIESSGPAADWIFMHLSGFDLKIVPRVGMKLSKYAENRLDKNILIMLEPYYMQYSNLRKSFEEMIRSGHIPSLENTEFGKNIPRFDNLFSSRFFARRSILCLENGKVRIKQRQKGFLQDFSHLHRNDHRILNITRFSGRALNFLKLDGLLERIFTLARVLGRRSSWLG